MLLICPSTVSTQEMTNSQISTVAVSVTEEEEEEDEEC